MKNLLTYSKEKEIVSFRPTSPKRSIGKIVPDIFYPKVMTTCPKIEIQDSFSR